MSQLPGLQLDRMMALLRKGLGGLDDTDLPDAEAEELLNLSLWELEDRFPFFEKECVVMSACVIDRRDYPIPNDLDALVSVAVRGDEDVNDLQWMKLERMSKHFYDEAYNEDTDTHQKPTHYIRIKNTLFLWPTPDKEYPLQLTFWRSLASLLSGTVDVTGLPRNWDELVVEGAISRGHFYAQDYNLARQASDFQLTKVRGATLAKLKEEKYDSRYARLRPVIDESDLELHPEEDPLTLLRPFITRSRGVG